MILVLSISTPFTMSSTISLFQGFRITQARLMVLSIIHGFRPNTKLKANFGRLFFADIPQPLFEGVLPAQLTSRYLGMFRSTLTSWILDDMIARVIHSSWATPLIFARFLVFIDLVVPITGHGHFVPSQAIYWFYPAVYHAPLMP